MIERLKDPMRATPAARILIKGAAAPKLDSAAKTRWGVEVIRSLLPEEEGPNTSLLTEMLVVKAWTGEDYGYEPGAEPAKNNAALKRCRDWAAKAAH